MIDTALVILLSIGAVVESYHANWHKRQLFGKDSVTHPASTTKFSTIKNVSRKISGSSTFNATTSTTASPTNHIDKNAADIAIAVITIIVMVLIIVMAVYFIRKCDQLNKMIPTYRYSSLKTEINGVNDFDDKIENQLLVNASTEEEDDFDEEEMPSPPTLIIQSQTTQASGKMENHMPLPVQNKLPPVSSINAKEIKHILATDSDDELLQ